VEAISGLSSRHQRAQTSQNWPSAEPSQAAKPPVPSLIFGDGFLKVCFPKIRPKRIGDDHFRVADLPEKEVGNPAFSAGANEKVGVGDRGEKTVADRS